MHSCFHWYKKRNNRSRNAKVMMENKVARFYVSQCIITLQPMYIHVFPIYSY